ncbi:hypothetical protein BTI679_55110 [Bacillus wiedmannii]|nr:hypothetical protein BTI679_55110 [Bacillus wiedmannii]
MNLAYARFFYVVLRDSYDETKTTYAGLYLLFPGLCKNE